MSVQLRQRLFQQINSWTIVDPHTHINPHAPAARNLADILGYHYYTELAHSAGVDKGRIEEPGLDPREKVRRLVEFLPHLSNTVQASWLVEIAREFFGFQHETVTPDNWEALYDSSEATMASADWPQRVLAKSQLSGVFLTNEFDDPLTGFDTRQYIPCLRTDDLVFHLHRPAVRERLERFTGEAAADGKSLGRALDKLFEHFQGRGAKACAISLPPDFTPSRHTESEADAALQSARRLCAETDRNALRTLRQTVFWKLAERCETFGLPFDLMIGVNRGVYAAGVYQGQDLYDSRVSLIQYRDLFNAFPRVTFPISVLASVTNQELVSYSWIFPNVVAHGHWWYSNTPAYIEHDLAARLEAVPRNKQIGYYSDMYMLEFALPKFAMYKRILAKVLAERFVIDRNWSEERAIDLARAVLKDNAEQIFGSVER